jgi:hypothetical protein
MADGSLVAPSDQPSPKSFPDLLALSDVMGAGWFEADAAQVAPGLTVAVVGDECHGGSSRCSAR